MLIIIQPNIIRALNASALGRLMLISAILFCTIRKQIVGLSLALLVIAVLNQTGPEQFAIEKEGDDDDDIKDDDMEEDREMTEKKMITPISSHNVIPIITPLEEDPYSIEPDAFGGIEPFAAF